MANRYYVDQAYDAAIVRPIKLAARLIYRFVEIDVVDFTVDGIARLARYTAARVRMSQTGYVRNYALLILFGAVLMVGYYVVAGPR
jgi:NADH-quinone oxidoreductase subunit L